MTSISVFIPVYRESEQVFDMLDKLSMQSADKEVIVTVDEPTKEFLERIQESHPTKLLVNQERAGKVNALNEAAKVSTGEVLVFLDSDIELPNDPDFLKKIVQKMEYADVLDIAKKVNKDSFLSRMAYYEYFTFNASSWLAAKYLQKCPAVNGAAFAIRRETFESINGFRKVVAEDIDIATRAFLKNSTFAYSNDVEVTNHVFSNWKSWFKQRRRWAIGQWLWFKDWYKDLARVFLRKPQVMLPGLFFLYPSIMMVFLNVAIPSNWAYQSLWVASFLISVKLNVVLPVFLVSFVMADLLKSVIISLASFVVTALIFFWLFQETWFQNKDP